MFGYKLPVKKMCGESKDSQGGFSKSHHFLGDWVSGLLWGMGENISTSLSKYQHNHPSSRDPKLDDFHAFHAWESNLWFSWYAWQWDIAIPIVLPILWYKVGPGSSFKQGFQPRL